VDDTSRSPDGPERLDATQSPLRVPTLDDVHAARERIAPHLRPTRLYRYPVLEGLVGTEVWVKHENHQPVGAFKARGGVNLVSQLSPDERERGLITASSSTSTRTYASSSSRSCATFDTSTLPIQVLGGRDAAILQHLQPEIKLRDRASTRRLGATPTREAAPPRIPVVIAAPASATPISA